MKSLSGAVADHLTFGTMQWGGRADEPASRAMFDDCRAAAIMHFDTAHLYCGGRSEEFLGRFAKGCRDELIIATKVGYAGGAGRDNILRTFDISRSRLSMDMVDLLYMHRFDDETDLSETFETLAELRSKGQIRYIGVSNYAAWQVMKAQAVAATFDIRIDAIQPMYSMVKRQAEVEIFPMAADQDIAVVPYSPLGGGLLTGKYARGETGRLSEDSRYAARYGVDWMHDAARNLSEIAEREGVAAATLAVAWAARHPVRPAPIISASSAEQLQPSLAASEFEMSDTLYQELTSLTRTPAPATDRLEEA